MISLSWLHTSTSLSACVYVCLLLSGCMLDCMSVSLSVLLYVCLSIYLSACLSICLSVCLPVCLSVCLPLSECFFLSSLVCFPLSLSLSLFVCGLIGQLFFLLSSLLKYTLRRKFRLIFFLIHCYFLTSLKNPLKSIIKNITEMLYNFFIPTKLQHEYLKIIRCPPPFLS